MAVAWQVWRFFVKLSLCTPWKDVDGAEVDCVWNVMAHAQKPDFIFQRNRGVHLNRRGRQFSRQLAAEVCASSVVMLDTSCSEVVWRVICTHSIRQFPLHFPSHASCAITFQQDSTAQAVNIVQQFGVKGQLKCDATCAEIRFRLSAKWTNTFKSAGRQLSRLLVAEVCASAIVMLDTPFSDVVSRLLATHSIHQFPLHFPSRSSPCTITFQLESTTDWAVLLRRWNRVMAMYSQFAETLKLLAFRLFPCLITYFPEENGSLYSAVFLTRHLRRSLSSLQWLPCRAMQHSSLHSSLYLLCNNEAQLESLRVGGGDTMFQIWLFCFWS